MNFNHKLDKTFWAKAGAWILGGVVVLQSPILQFVPRFFKKQTETQPNGSIPVGLWVLFGATIVAAGLTAWDKSLSKKRESEARQRRTQQEGFFRSYAECLADAVKAVQTSADLSAQELRDAQQTVLRVVRDIVRLFLERPDGHMINASVMQRASTSEWSDGLHFKPEVHFAAPDRVLNAYRHVLVLTVWAEPPNTDDQFALPVANQDDILLFGAPRAFVHGTLQYVPNTQDAGVVDSLVERQDDVVRQAIRDYLSRRTEVLVSFISVPLRCGDAIVGVLNVQSNRAEILGPDKIYENDLESCLLPFCALLGMLIVQAERAGA